MAIKLEIVTPEKLVFSQDVEMATLPGVEGEFGVLENHSPLISELQEGVVSIFANQNGGTPQQSYHIDGGVAQVTATACTILAGSVTVVDADHPAPSVGGPNRGEAENKFATARH